MLLEFPSTEDGMKSALTHLDQHARTLSLPDALLWKLRVVLEELYTNVLRYGVVGADQHVTVDLQTGAAYGTAQLRMITPGVMHDPFKQLELALHQRPVEDRPVGRLGWVLVHGLCDAAEFDPRERDCVFTFVLSAR